MAASTDQDSPQSITSNVVGILTFVAAIEAAIYARVTYLRNSDGKNFRIKTSLSWCKTGSAWLAGLLPALNAQHDDGGGSRRRKMDVEAKASTGSTIDSRFALMPRSWQGGRLSVAMARLPFLQMSIMSSRLRDQESDEVRRGEVGPEGEIRRQDAFMGGQKPREGSP